MKLFILAGGFGTRLSGVINQLPKALAPIGGIPFLKLQLQKWIAQGFSDFTFLLHHQADQIISFLNLESELLLSKSRVKWVVEQVPMGTGGAVAHALSKTHHSGDFFLTNADTWISSDITPLLSATAPAISVVRMQNCSRYGAVIVDENFYVTNFLEKELTGLSGWVNAGFYRLNANSFLGLDSKIFSLEQIFLPQFISENLLKAVPLDGTFVDIGVPEDYFFFCKEYVTKALK